MCKIDNCNRHEFNHGLCLYHLKVDAGVIKPKPVKRARKKAAPKAGPKEAPVESESDSE